MASSRRADAPYSAAYSAGYTPSALSVALDEIYMLRALAAHVAGSFQKDLETATLPASVRRRREELFPLLQLAAEGEALYGHFDPKPALARMNVDDTLTVQSWSENQGVSVD